MLCLPAAATSAQTAQKIGRLSKSVVLLVMEDKQGQPIAYGSGFFVEEGTIATNLHVVDQAHGGYFKTSGQKKVYDLRDYFHFDADHDLALLKAGLDAPKLQPLLVMDSLGSAEVGDDVFVISNPKGLEGTLSRGIVSGVRLVGPDTLLQITAPISPGSSGGPVLDSAGQVIGIAVAAFLDGQNLNFAVPASYLRRLIEKKSAVASFPYVPRAAKERSETWRLATSGRDAIEAGSLMWGEATKHVYGPARFTVSLHNRLRVPVRNVEMRIVFHNQAGDPIESAVLKCSETIGPGLATRFIGYVDASVQQLTTREWWSYDSMFPCTPIRYTIIGFEIAE